MQQSISIYSKYLNKYMPRDRFSKVLLNTSYGEKSLKIGEKVVSHFPIHVYNGLEDLAK